MFKPSIKFVVTTAAAGAVLAGVGTVALIRHLRKNKRRKGHFLTNRRRRVITDFLEVAVSDIPHGPIADSLYRHHIQGLSDKRLLILYAAMKVGEFIRGAGIDPTEVTEEQLASVKARYLEAETEKAHDREGMLGALLGHELTELKPLFVIALAVLALV